MCLIEACWVSHVFDRFSICYDCTAVFWWMDTIFSGRCDNCSHFSDCSFVESTDQAITKVWIDVLEIVFFSARCTQNNVHDYEPIIISHFTSLSNQWLH